MVVVVSVSFVLSWSPFYLTTFVSQMQEVSFLRKSNFVFVMLCIHLAGFLNSCINPLIYTCMSRRFRESFRRIAYRILCFGKKPAHSRTLSLSTYRYTSGVPLGRDNSSYYSPIIRHKDSCINMSLQTSRPNSIKMIERGGSNKLRHTEKLQRNDFNGDIASTDDL